MLATLIIVNPLPSVEAIPVYFQDLNPIQTVQAEVRELTIEEKVKHYDWDDDLALGIMNCESTASSTIVNDNPNTGDHSIGLFQINIYGANAKERPTEEELKNPDTNIAFAYKLYKDGGFKRHWTNCYNKYYGL